MAAASSLVRFRASLAALLLATASGLAGGTAPAAADAPPSAPACVAPPYVRPGAPPPVTYPHAAAGRASGLRSFGDAPAARAPASTEGEVRLLTVLAEFADVPHRAPPARFEERLFGPGPSLRAFVDEVSGGRLVVTGSVVGWVTLPGTQYAYSQGNGGIGTYPDNAQRMTEDAVAAAAAAGLDLRDWDADGDGVVDALLVVHSGQGLEWSGTSDPRFANSTEPDLDAIVSHRWVVSDGVVGDGLPRVADYFTTPELQLVVPAIAPAWTDSVSTIGVICHEFGHVLGLPDLYDTQTFASRVGPWALMDYGSWNAATGDAPGATPSHPCAWSKTFLGWTEAIAVAPPLGEETAVRVSLASASGGGEPLRLLPNPGGVDWRPTGPGEGEYFLAELRTHIGSDAGLPGEGLLVYHVDEGSASNRAGDHPFGGGVVVLVPRDGTTGTTQTLGDPWTPGSSLGETTVPSSAYHDGDPSGVALGGIAAEGGGAVALDVVVASLRGSVALAFARPNPFAPGVHGATTLVFSLDAVPPTGVAIEIVDVAGRRVRRLAGDARLVPGGRALRWDGRGDDGRPLPGGVYFFRAGPQAGSGPGKVVLVR